MPEKNASMIAIFKPGYDGILAVIKAGGYPLRYGRWKNVVVFKSDNPNAIRHTRDAGAYIVVNGGSSMGCGEIFTRSKKSKNNLNEAFTGA